LAPVKTIFPTRFRFAQVTGILIVRGEEGVAETWGLVVPEPGIEGTVLGEAGSGCGEAEGTFGPATFTEQPESVRE
jgi:hypothetical protein